MILSEGRPKIKPAMPAARAAQGRASKKGTPSLAHKMADVYPPTAIKPACPMEIWPQYPVRILSPWTLITEMPIIVRMVSTLSLQNSGQAKRRRRKAATLSHCSFEWKIAMSWP